MDRPGFSVVIATYNRGALIVPTIESALRQTCPPTEILVIGDGCTDDTEAVLATHFDDRVQWHNLPENSRSQSFPNNEGIRRALGSHIAYLGHDDIWSRDHLAALAGVIEKTQADIAVSGTIFYPPEGADHWRLTGIFDDPEAPAREFFPPSSLAHPRDLTERIGPWAAPETLDSPVDTDLLFRANAAGCTFASTGRVTVHKFAAGHRYLSYRYPSADEQRAMLEEIARPEAERALIAGILNRIAYGGIVQPVLHEKTYAGFGAGTLFRRARALKGLSIAEPVKISATTELPLEPGLAAFDWQGIGPAPDGQSVRYAHRNPNPVWLVNIRIAVPFSLRIPLVIADPALADALTLDVNDAPATPRVVDRHGGKLVLLVDAPAPLPVTDGIKLTFHTRAVGHGVPPWQGPWERRFALGRITVVVEP